MFLLYYYYRHLSRVILNKIRKETKFSKNFFATPLGDILLYTKEKCKIISRYYIRTYDLWDTWYLVLLPKFRVCDKSGPSQSCLFGIDISRYYQRTYDDGGPAPEGALSTPIPGNFLTFFPVFWEHPHIHTIGF